MVQSNAFVVILRSGPERLPFHLQTSEFKLHIAFLGITRISRTLRLHKYSSTSLKI